MAQRRRGVLIAAASGVGAFIAGVGIEFDILTLPIGPGGFRLNARRAGGVTRIVATHAVEIGSIGRVVEGPAVGDATSRGTITATSTTASIIALGGTNTGSGIAISATLGVAFAVVVAGCAASDGSGIAFIIAAIRFVGAGCGRA